MAHNDSIGKNASIVRRISSGSPRIEEVEASSLAAAPPPPPGIRHIISLSSGAWGGVSGSGWAHGWVVEKRSVEGGGWMVVSTNNYEEGGFENKRGRGRGGRGE